LPSSDCKRHPHKIIINILIHTSGGLGHFGVLWSVAMGAETYVISHSASKKEDAMKMGAKGFLLTSEKGWADDY
jgi:D-arabinose 1-dehydrogenase-like Zn-dependent alcohol dehydrogenase